MTSSSETRRSLGDDFLELFDVVVRLRGPGGCSWDREQNPLSLRKCLIEETYECIEAINEGKKEEVKDELGDLFLLTLMISYMHEQEGSFSVGDVLKNLTQKLIRRHPHVFDSLKVKDTDEILDNWARIKIEQEGRTPKDSILDGAEKGLPPLELANVLQKKAAKIGFDWPEISGVINKIEEELGEIKELLSSGQETNGNANEIEGELGDLLFSVVNLCRFLKIEPSIALQRTNTKFTKRFKHVEKRMKESNTAMKKENPALMDKYWEEAKGI